MKSFHTLQISLVLILAIGLNHSGSFAQDDKGKTAPKQETQSDPKKDVKGDEKKSDETKKDSKSSDEAKTYFDLLTEWKQLEDQLKAKEAEFIASTQLRRDAIKKEFDELLKSVETLIPTLRKTAIAAYEAKPNEDESLVRLLVGMLTDDLHKKRYNEFFDLGDVLIKGKCDLKHLQAIHNAKRLVSFGIGDPINELINRYNEAQKDDLPRAVIKTSYGDIVIELFEDSAPNHVANFISLASRKFYDKSEWHRVDTTVNVVQGGKPADGKEIDYTLAGEWDKPGRRLHFKGHIGAARTPDPNSASSQFYIMTDRAPELDVIGNSYTVFGRVLSGMEFVHQIKVGDKMLSVEINRKRNHEYKPTPYKPGSPNTQPEKKEDKADPKKKEAEKSAETPKTKGENKVNSDADKK